MKCRNCGRDITDNSVFCNWCGQRQLKLRRDPLGVNIPEPTLLPSGKWRIQLRREGLSITEDDADTCRRLARAARIKWQAEEDAGLHAPPPEKLLLGDAIDLYIDSNTNTLSASTIRAYKSYRAHRFQPCMSWDMNDDSLNWQMAVNLEAADVSAKTVFNAWHLITATFSFCGLQPPKVTLPRRAKNTRPFLPYTQIGQFLEAIRGTDVELPALLALSSLRHSEIISLRPTDISPDGKTVSIHASRVLNSDNQYELQEINKTDKSTRIVRIVIPRLQELLMEAAQSNSEFVCDWTEKRMYDHINRACKKAGLPNVGVHGLRHTFASLAYHLDWKKKSTMDMGGWSNSQIVDSVYTHNADLEDDLKRMENFYGAIVLKK